MNVHPCFAPRGRLERRSRDLRGRQKAARRRPPQAPAPGHRLRGARLRQEVLLLRPGLPQHRRLLTLGRNATLPRASPRQLLLDFVEIDLDPRRTTVDDDTNSRTVRLSPSRNLEELSKNVSHKWIKLAQDQHLERARRDATNPQCTRADASRRDAKRTEHHAPTPIALGRSFPTLVLVAEQNFEL